MSQSLAVLIPMQFRSLLAFIYAFQDQFLLVFAKKKTWCQFSTLTNLWNLYWYSGPSVLSILKFSSCLKFHCHWPRTIGTVWREHVEAGAVNSLKHFVRLSERPSIPHVYYCLSFLKERRNISWRKEKKVGKSWDKLWNQRMNAGTFANAGVGRWGFWAWRHQSRQRLPGGHPGCVKWKWSVCHLSSPWKKMETDDQMILREFSLKKFMMILADFSKKIEDRTFQPHLTAACTPPAREWHSDNSAELPRVGTLMRMTMRRPWGNLGEWPWGQCSRKPSIPDGSDKLVGCVWKWGIPPKSPFWWKFCDKPTDFGIP